MLTWLVSDFLAQNATGRVHWRLQLACDDFRYSFLLENPERLLVSSLCYLGLSFSLFSF